MVVVRHDFAGEYGHSQHMVCADIMAEAVTVSNDPAQYPELTEIYGLWDVPKTYIHLYEENPIVIDLDTPLESFGVKTAFEVSKYLAFPKHASQYNDVCYHINPFKTAAAMRYSPCNYGLLRSTVGEDVQKNDFFENVMSYEQQRLAEEAQTAVRNRRVIFIWISTGILLVLVGTVAAVSICRNRKKLQTDILRSPESPLKK